MAPQFTPIRCTVHLPVFICDVCAHLYLGGFATAEEREEYMLLVSEILITIRDTNLGSERDKKKNFVSHSFQFLIKEAYTFIGSGKIPPSPKKKQKTKKAHHLLDP